MDNNEKTDFYFRLVSLHSDLAGLLNDVSELLFKDTYFADVFAKVLNKDDDERMKIKLIDIDSLSIRALNVLRSIDINTLGELLRTPKEYVLVHVRSCGKKTIQHIKEVLKNNYDIDW